MAVADRMSERSVFARRRRKLLGVPRRLQLRQQQRRARRMYTGHVSELAESDVMQRLSRGLLLLLAHTGARTVRCGLVCIRGLNQLLGVCRGLGVPLWHS